MQRSNTERGTRWFKKRSAKVIHMFQENYLWNMSMYPYILHSPYHVGPLLSTGPPTRYSSRAHGAGSCHHIISGTWWCTSPWATSYHRAKLRLGKEVLNSLKDWPSVNSPEPVITPSNCGHAQVGPPPLLGSIHISNFVWRITRDSCLGSSSVYKAWQSR